MIVDVKELRKRFTEIVASVDERTAEQEAVHKEDSKRNADRHVEVERMKERYLQQQQESEDHEQKKDLELRIEECERQLNALSEPPQSTPREEAVYGIYFDLALLEKEVKENIKEITDKSTPQFGADNEYWIKKKEELEQLLAEIEAAEIDKGLTAESVLAAIASYRTLNSPLAKGHENALKALEFRLQGTSLAEAWRSVQNRNDGEKKNDEDAALNAIRKTACPLLQIPYNQVKKLLLQ